MSNENLKNGKKIISGPECPNCSNTEYVRKIKLVQVLASLIMFPLSLLILFIKYHYCTNCGGYMPKE